MATADLKGVPQRLHQELARHAALAERATRNLQDIARDGQAKAAKARALMQKLEPALQKWVDAGMPEDERMERYARVYKRAVETLGDAELGQLRAEQALGEAGSK